MYLNRTINGVSNDTRCWGKQFFLSQTKAYHCWSFDAQRSAFCHVPYAAFSCGYGSASQFGAMYSALFGETRVSNGILIQSPVAVMREAAK